MSLGSSIIFESSSANNPQLPKIILVDLNATVTNALKGETIVGETSGASAVFVESNGTNESFHSSMKMKMYSNLENQ